MSAKPYTPAHVDIAAWCGVSLSTVRGWSSGTIACAHHYLCTIAEHDPAVDLDALTRLWVERWREKTRRRTAMTEDQTMTVANALEELIQLAIRGRLAPDLMGELVRISKLADEIGGGAECVEVTADQVGLHVFVPMSEQPGWTQLSVAAGAAPAFDWGRLEVEQLSERKVRVSFPGRKKAHT